MADTQINKDPEDENLKQKAREVARDRYGSENIMIWDTDDVDLDVEDGCWVTAQLWIADWELGIEEAIRRKLVNRYRYWKCCCDFPNTGRSYNALVDMINDNIEITRRTFLKHVDREEQRQMELSLSYVLHPRTDHGLTMAADWHVTYHRSKYAGKRVYYFRYSSTEYIYTESQ